MSVPVIIPIIVWQPRPGAQLLSAYLVGLIISVLLWFSLDWNGDISFSWKRLAFGVFALVMGSACLFSFLFVFGHPLK